jgi:hypothetical protein
VIETSFGRNVVINAANDTEARSLFSHYHAETPAQAGSKKTLVKKTIEVLEEDTL